MQVVDTGHHLKSRFSIFDAERAVEIFREVVARNRSGDDDAARNGKGSSRVAGAQLGDGLRRNLIPSAAVRLPEAGVVASGQQERGGADRRQRSHYCSMRESFSPRK